MVREAVDAINGDKIERVLVCITISDKLPKAY